MYLTRERTAAAVFRIARAEETTFAEAAEGPRLTKSSAVLVYEGEIRGEGLFEELKVHFAAGRSSTYGLQRFTGEIGGFSGSVVLHGTGRLRTPGGRVKLAVVPGSGTQGLKGLRGEMKLDFRPGGFSAVLDYRFA